jgi:hypothetical protein
MVQWQNVTFPRLRYGSDSRYPLHDKTFFFFQEKRKEFDFGAYIQFRSNSFYQKFVGKIIAPPHFARRGKNTNSLARAQKILLGCGAKGNFLRPCLCGNFFIHDIYYCRFLW